MFQLPGARLIAFVAVTITSNLASAGGIFWVDIDQHRVKWMDPDDGNQSTVVEDTFNDPMSIALDPRDNGKIYWGTEQGLFRSDLNGSDLSLIEIGWIESVAFDPNHDVIFWSDATGCQRENNEGGLFARQLDGFAFATIEPGPFCRGIAIDGSEGKLYWTSFATSPWGIYRANLDGTSKEIHVAFDLLEVGGYLIALDIEGGKIYWISINPNPPYQRTIKRANLSDGSQKESLIDVPGYSHGGLTVNSTEGKMYWTEFDDPGRIRRANLDGSGAEDVALFGVAHLGGVIVDSRIQHCTRTAMYADITNLEGSVEFGDVSAVVDAFRGQPLINPTLCDLYPCDLGGRRCMGDGLIDFRDVSQVVDAFRAVYTNCPE